MKNDKAIPKVSLESTNEAIVLVITRLTLKSKNHSCRKCIASKQVRACHRCVYHFYDVRDAALRIFRSIFEINKEYDLPPILIHHASKAALLNDLAERKAQLMKSVDFLKKMYHNADGGNLQELIALIPKQKTCEVCNKVMKPSLFLPHTDICRFCAHIKN